MHDCPPCPSFRLSLVSLSVSSLFLSHCFFIRLSCCRIFFPSFLSFEFVVRLFFSCFSVKVIRMHEITWGIRDKRNVHKSSLSLLFLTFPQHSCFSLFLDVSPLFVFGGEFCMKERLVYVSLVLTEGSGMNVTSFSFYSSP